MKQINMLDLHAEYQHMKPAIDGSISECLEHHRWILGPEVKALEAAVCDYLGVKYAIGVSSGTDALIIALRAEAIKRKPGEQFFSPQDKVITTPFTFTATGSSIMHAGASPLFVDIDPVTFNICPKQIEAALEAHDNVVGILPVHLFGQSANMDAIMQLAYQYNLFVIEDTAQGFGAAWNDKKLATIGDSGTFSFFPSKNLGGFGDGGMIVTNDEQIAELSRILMQHGGKDKNNVDYLGYNARLDSLQAGIILGKLDYIDDFNAKRRAIAHHYSEALAAVSGIVVPREDALANVADVYHVYHQYTLSVLDGKRDALKAFLQEKGIGSMTYYPYPLHTMKLFDKPEYQFGDLKHTVQAAKEVLSLPVEPLMSEEERRYICESIKAFFA